MSRTSTKRRKKKVYNLDRLIDQALRKIWFWSPMRREAMYKGVVSWKKIRIGKKTRNVIDKYVCALCKKTKDNDKEKHNVDHINAVVDPAVGRQTRDVYITRLFCVSEQLRMLCKTCHSEVTEQQRKLRKSLTDARKADKDK